MMGAPRAGITTSTAFAAHAERRLERRGSEHLLDIGAEPFAVDRPIDDEGSSEPIAAWAGDESRRLPMTVGEGADEALASRTAAIAAYHVGGDPGLVEEDETNWVQSPLAVPPSRAGRRHVRPVLLGGMKRLFLS